MQSSQKNKNNTAQKGVFGNQILGEEALHK
jgi:hypothetical protein